MIGRDVEQEIFDQKMRSDKSEFIAVLGRRRVGKTFLIRNYFTPYFTFQITGMAKTSLRKQLQNFNTTIKEQHPKQKAEKAKDWLTAFSIIKKIIGTSKQQKKVIFIDELPWFDTPNSGFMSALEHFWNSWASARTDVVLVVCGSAAAWMLNKLINNRGGLHNRITCRIKVEPFSLNECEQFVNRKKLSLNQYQIVQLYMVIGGIPYYWDELAKGESPVQGINRMCFKESGLLKSEFNNLFKSLFNFPEKYEKIIESLSSKSKGLNRNEIVKKSKFSNGGGMTRMLAELEESGFISKYYAFGKLNRDHLYQLSDPYCLFYFRFIKNNTFTNENFWISNIDNPKVRAWSSLAYEQVCYYHLKQIKKALGISGIDTNASTWRGQNSENNAQIDLVIDRRDMVINLCEIKYSQDEYIIDKKYDEELRNKVSAFRQNTKTKKALFTTMITTFGIKSNTYAHNINSNVTMIELFEK